MQAKLDTVRGDGKGDPVLPEVKQLVHVLQDCCTVITPTYSIAQYFDKVGVDYFRVVSLSIESKVLVRHFRMFSGSERKKDPIPNHPTSLVIAARR